MSKPHPFLNFYGDNDKNFKLIIDGISYRAVEYYFQSQKFLGPEATNTSIEYANIILNANTPYKAKILARQEIRYGYAWRNKLNLIIQEYKNKGVVIRKDWENVKNDIMYKAIYEKFTQNPHLLDLLKSTGNQDLRIATNHYWRNQVAIILMEIRDSC